MPHVYCSASTSTQIHIQQLIPQKITMRAEYITLTDDSGGALLIEPSIVAMSSIARRTVASVRIALWLTP